MGTYYFCCMLSSHQKIAAETLLKGANGSMRTITICVGSACHMKGAHHVIDRLQELIAEHGLENEVELKASFCMDRCRGNIGTVIDDKDIFDLTRDNVDEIFDREILGAR